MHRVYVGVEFLLLPPFPHTHHLQLPAVNHFCPPHCLQLLLLLLLLTQFKLPTLPPFTVVAPVCSTRATGEGVCMAVLSSCPRHHCEVISLELLQPPGDLPLRLPE